MPRTPYANLYERIVANIAEPGNEQACWCWRRRLGKGAYARIDVYVPCYGDNVTMQAHVALWVWLEAAPRSIDEFFWAYREFIASGLELDHLCVMPNCINPDHMEPVTPRENSQRRDARRKHTWA